MNEPLLDHSGTPPVVRIQLLGGFAVWVNEEQIPEEQWRSHRARSLVKLLALAPGHRLHRDQVLDTLWPDSDLSAAANNLHQTVFAARHVLEAAGAGALVLEEGFLHLGGDAGLALAVDVEQFEAAARQAKACQDPAAYQAALAWYAGDLLPDDRYEEWTLQRRETLRQVYLQLLLDLAGLYEACGEYAPAIETLLRLLAADRSHEAAHAGLMRLYALSGQRQQALRQYQALCEALRADVDAEPSPTTRQLFQAIQSGRFAAAASPEALSVSPPHNLPVQLTSFIGRDAQIAEVTRLVTGHHLVTLTGAGGTGKTRLALQVAEQALGQFPQGAWLAELAPISDPDLVPRAVAEVLGLVDQPGQSLIQTITGFLQSRSLLLVLDNCEHVIGGASALVSLLLRACRGLYILATSREILEVEGETLFRCPSLTLPEEGQAGLDSLARSEAVRLFVERAQSVRPDFALSETNAAQLAQIVRRLEGIPLAIELAAARVRMLSVEQIAAHLDQAFRLLTGGSRSALPRHQTLKALIDWSYNLLSPEERALLLRLSVFAGGWTLEAAEQVCSDTESTSLSTASTAEAACTAPEGATGPAWLPGEQIIELSGQLIDKSLIQFEPSSGKEPRYSMLETVRQYAHGRLVESGERETIRARHLDYYLSLALRAEPHLRDFQAKYWLDRLEQEMDNLRLALEWSLACPESSSSGIIKKGLQIAASLLQFWHIHNRDIEGAEWLERLLREQRNQRCFQNLDLAGRVARARALNVLSFIIGNGENRLMLPRQLVEQKSVLDQESQTILQELGEAYRRDYAISRINSTTSRSHEKAVEILQECRNQFREMSDLFWMSECDQILTNMYAPTDEKALFYIEEDLALKKEIGDKDGEAWALYYLGTLERWRKNLDRATELMKESLAMFKTVGNREYAARAQTGLAMIALWRGDYQEAISQFGLAHNTVIEINHIPLLIENLQMQGLVAWAKREYELAVRCCEEILELVRDYPVDWGFYARYLLGQIALSQGDTTLATTYIKSLLKDLKNEKRLEGFRVFCFQIIHLLGVLLVMEGQMRPAAIMFGSQDAFCSWGMTLLPPPALNDYEQALAAARATLGEEDFRIAWEAGRAMPRAQAIQYALETLGEG